VRTAGDAITSRQSEVYADFADGYQRSRIDVAVANPVVEVAAFTKVVVNSPPKTKS
jgi:hypothetical protein